MMFKKLLTTTKTTDNNYIEDTKWWLQPGELKKDKDYNGWQRRMKSDGIEKKT